MRSLRGGLRVVAAGSAAVAVGVAVNQVLNGGRWNLRWLVTAVVLAVLSEGINLWLGTREAAPNDAARPTLWPGLAGENGMPLLLGDVAPRDLGVHPSRFDAQGASPYVAREADGVLESALLADVGKRLVIVEGPRLSGATSTLAQAAQAYLPDHLAAGFADDPRVPLEDMIAQASRWAAAARAEAVVWLDGLGPGRFSELARIPLGDLPSGVRVLATLDTGGLEGLRVPEQLNLMLEQHAVRVRLGTITEQERRNLLAEDAYAALRPVLERQEDVFLGRLMVAWEPLRAALGRASGEQAAERVSLLRAVTDWYRVHVPRLLTADVLAYLYRAYRRELAGGTADNPVSATGLAEALRWATAAPSADRPRLIDLQEVPGGQRYTPHPLLAVIADDLDEDVSWPVFDALWSYSDRFFDGDQRRDIGYTALARGARHAAARLLSHADTAIAADAYGQLARLFFEHAEWAASRDWWKQALSTAHPDEAPRAMIGLGVVEFRQGDLSRARHWFQQAIATNHPDYAPKAMVNLGVLEDRQGDLGQARHWYQQAIATNHPDEAPKAMVGLGVVEEQQGDLDQARHWYQQAIATNDLDEAPAALARLSDLEDRQGNPDQARHWYQQAIATNHPDYAPQAMVDLGVLEEQQGDLGQARHWYQQAIATNDSFQAPAAMAGLGVLERQQGDLGQARHWYQQAIATNDSFQAPAAMAGLGVLEHQQGDLGQARHWYQQAIATNDSFQVPAAMANLGVLEHQQGDLGQARHWYQQAIATNRRDEAPRAMIGLGLLEEQQGNLDQARHWYQQAIATNHPRLASRAQQSLDALDQRERERQRGERFGRYGYLAYADLELMKPSHPGPAGPDTQNSEDEHTN